MSSVKSTIVYKDGRYPFAADAAYEPGDIITRPSGSLAVYDGLDGCEIGDRISPQPLTPYQTAEFPADTAATWAAGTQLYWDVSEDEITSTSTDNISVGKSIAAKTAGQTKAHVECTG